MTLTLSQPWLYPHLSSASRAPFVQQAIGELRVSGLGKSSLIVFSTTDLDPQGPEKLLNPEPTKLRRRLEVVIPRRSLYLGGSKIVFLWGCLACS